MANGWFRVFDVGEGDCIFLDLKDEDKRFVIMVDCGSLTEDVENYIIDELEGHINLLIITHIDEDHIIGIKGLLEKYPDLLINQIIYNCGQNVKIDDLKDLPDKYVEILNRKIQENQKHYHNSNIASNISASQATSLGKIILSNPNFANAWKVQNECITSESSDISLGDNFGKIIFLSPNKVAIDKLNVLFKKAFFDNFFDLYNGPYKEETTLFEILINGLMQSRERAENHISSTICSTDIVKRIASEDTKNVSISPSNRASIAFIWECRNKRILFSGDADPLIIVTNFLRKSQSQQGHYFFEVIKVPHHGSSHNCYGEFWETFDSNQIFITGYEEFKRPSRECLCKIVSRPTLNTRFIHYMRENRHLKWLNSNPDVPVELSFSLSTNLVHEFTY